MRLNIQALKKSYTAKGQQRSVLNSLDLEMRSGEYCLIYGDSGCGKSTLLHLIAGIDVADEGRISLDHQQLQQFNDDQRTLFRRRHLGFVFQFFNLLPHLTVEGNVKLPLQLLGWQKNQQTDRVNMVLQQVGLQSRMTDYPERLSGGEQQRVAIARAIVHKPQLLLADEPTGNLDENKGKEILQLLRTINKSEAMSVIMATHSRQATHFADSIYYLRDGHLQQKTDR